MARPRKSEEVSQRPRRAPATTPEARERQMISLAMDVAEEQMRRGTASPTVITHYLRLATEKEKLEREKLRRENEVLRAKVEQHESAKNVEQLYQEALDAMRMYSGNTESKDPYDEY